jgi:hypothetical protein
VLDLRSPESLQFGMPTDRVDRTESTKPASGGSATSSQSASADRRPTTSFASGAEPVEPDALADVLAVRWPVRLDHPRSAGTPWTLTLSVED